MHDCTQSLLTFELTAKIILLDLLDDDVWSSSRDHRQREFGVRNATGILRRHDAEVKDLAGKHVARVEA